MRPDPYKYFRVEARELLDQLVQGALSLEKGVFAPELVPKLLRLAHTLKGAARVVKQVEIAEFAHAVEEALVPLRDQAKPFSQELARHAFELLDAIEERLKHLEPPREAESEPAPRPPADELLRTVRVDIGEMDALLDGILEANTQLGSVRRALGTLERARGVADLLLAQLASPRTRGAEGQPDLGPAARTSAWAEELRAEIVALDRQLTSSADQLERELRQVRQRAEQLRLLPANAVFASLERTARDVAQTAGKRVAFETKGGEARLDAHVLATIHGALVQVVRNAVAHGIETEAERTQAGKPTAGRVLVEVARVGNRVAFRCQDDGRGVDLEAVRRAAQKKGILSKDTEHLRLDELVQLLLKGGLTTARTVSEMSGRGIGLDVVRDAASRLGAEVTLKTEAGRGSALEIVVPISLSSLDALMVEVAGMTTAIPLDAVRGAFHIRTADAARLAGADSIVYEGNALPFLPLAYPLREKVSPGHNGGPGVAVVVGTDSELAAIGVDRLVGIMNVVMRPLPRVAPVDPVVAGAALDAEGNPQIIVDPAVVVGMARRGDRPASAPEVPRAAPVLVVDDSLTTRMLEQSILESAGYQVDCAVSGEEALEKARQRQYALFLVDIEMPGMDGFTFVEQTRADPFLREIPSILVTSRSSAEDRRRGQAVGARAYIAKSEFDQAHLLRTIRTLVGNNQ
ncbi:MAG: response regulator [Candidatus Hydrogenedentes bacterium]|nr:response regulator [Candidatus Hydrogenedentota bacterium]